MRAETESWWRQAEADLDAAEINLRARVFFVAAWLAHQAAEKWVKALYVEHLGALPPRTHDLVQLGRDVSAPRSVATDLNVRNPAFGESCYPDPRRGSVPVDEITEVRASRYPDASRRILAWLRQQLNP